MPILETFFEILEVGGQWRNENEELRPFTMIFESAEKAKLFEEGDG